MTAGGLVQVYSGEGKGKTTAAVGQAVRAKAAGMEIMVIFFNKLETDSAGENSLLALIGIKTSYFASYHPDFYQQTTIEEMRGETAKGTNYVKRLFDENEYDMIILDEILISVRDGFIEESEIIDLMKKKPFKLELILTGRGITEDIRKEADLVSEITNVKHPYDMGVKWRKGIEI